MLVCPRAHADDAPLEASEAELARVEIRVVAGSEQYSKLRAALGEGALRPFDLSWTREAGFEPRMLLSMSRSAGAELVCWVDLREPRRARLYFSRGRTERYLVRQLPLSGTFNEMDQEALAQTIELSLRALNENTSFGLSREEVRPLLEREVEQEVQEPPAPPEPPAPAPAPRTVSLLPGAYYFIGAHSLQVPITHGPGVLLGLFGTHGRRRAALIASLRYELPQDYSDTRIELSFSTLAVRLEGELLGSIDPRGEPGRAFLGVRAGVGQDAVMLRPRSAPGEPGYQPVAAKLAPAWVVSGALVGTVRWGQHATLFAALGAQADPARVHYDLRDGVTDVVAIERLRVRPASMLGVTAW